MLHITAVFVVFEIIVANETHRHKCRLYKSATIGTLAEFGFGFFSGLKPGTFSEFKPDFYTFSVVVRKPLV